MTDHETHLSHDDTDGLGEFRLRHPPGTFALTIASRTSVCAIAATRERLRGTVVEWGCGVGVLSIAAASIPGVSRVIGLDILPANVEAARRNAASNGTANRTTFVVADSFVPVGSADRDRVASLAGAVDVLIANPPSSEGDDGFDFRRRILREATAFLVDGGIVLLSISSQYGPQRIDALSTIPGYTHAGVPASTGWVAFDMQRPDLLHCVELYAQEEERGGFAYEFRHPLEQTSMNARDALALHRETGRSPLSLWQTHLFEYRTP